MSSRPNLPVVPLVVGGVSMLMGLAFIVLMLYVAVIGPAIAEARATATPTHTPTPIATPTLTPTATATATSTPTITPTIPTNTPTSTPTATRIPATRIPPTATTIPSPTPVPATPVPPGYYHGIVNTQLSVDSARVQHGDPIWFNFSFQVNGTDTYTGFLGINAYTLSGQLVTFHVSWQDYRFPAGPFSWRDHLELSIPGQYNLFLVVCYSHSGVCSTAAGDWETLAGPVLVESY